MLKRLLARLILAKFQPKIHTIEPAIERILIIKNLVDEHDMVII